MSRRVGLLALTILAVTTACASSQLPALPTLTAADPASPVPTSSPALMARSTPTPRLTPSATSAAPTPSPTQIPVQQLTILWPEQVSGLEPIPIEVAVVPPPGVEATTALTAVVRHSHVGLVFEAPLTTLDDRLYTSKEPLHLPLKPPEGTYRLIILVESSIDTAGDRVLYFQPSPVALHDLDPGSETGVHPGVQMSLPLEFAAVVANGGPWAGSRVWRYGEGEVSLWWAPGPTEALLANNALVMLEATHDPQNPPQIVRVTETEWQERRAFLFRERWPGTAGGPAEALVVQGADFWLHVLRIRARGGASIPPVLYHVRESFSLVP